MSKGHTDKIEYEKGLSETRRQASVHSFEKDPTIEAYF